MHRRWVEIGLWTGLVFVSNTINATSVLIEYGRDGRPLEVWEPFVWEYSSGIFTLLLIYFVLAVDARFPLTIDTWKRMVPVHLLATVPHSLLHVAGMVSVRKIVYALAGRTYEFGNVPVELFYEWRKDAFSYFAALFVIHAYRIYLERAEGEANYVEPAAPDPLAAVPHFRVTYNRRDFNLDPSAVEWIESAGNYVVLHSADRTYLMRETMTNLEDRLSGTTFHRVHRSKMVNLAHVAETETRNGRLVLRLDTDAAIEVSRSYKPAVLSALDPSQGPDLSSLRPSTAK